MTMSPTEPGDPRPARRGVRRTAWLLGLVALAIYLGFIASGVIGRSGGAG